MKLYTIVFTVSACLGLVGGASASSDAGTLQFSGSVVQTGCAAMVRPGGWRVENCLPATREAAVRIQRVDHLQLAGGDGAGAVRVKNVSRREGDDAEYVLIDARGRQIGAGSYVVVRTLP